jgi:GAF domain-containing protein
VSKAGLYRELSAAAGGLLRGESDLVANAANLAAALFEALPDINWVGFYFLKEGTLVLGPFQGRPACTRIAVGKGVCGTAAEKRETVVVNDVHDFPGHIACDAASNSEIVVPLLRGGVLVGVLDADSPLRGRFDERDREGLERLAGLLLERSTDQ